MKDDHIKQFVHTFLKSHVTKTDTIIDATVGNGYDTLLLSELALQVIGFDIQQQAIDLTEQRLQSSNANNVTLIHDSFETISNFKGYKGVVFNLGFLPNGDKSITTLADITLRTVQSIASQMQMNDFILLTAYPGHPEGQKEANYLSEYIKTLDSNFIAITYQIQNRWNAPFVISIEKIKNC